jgi:serine palmitoyltransferase
LSREEAQVIETLPVISGNIGAKINADGVEMDNLASYNFIGIMGSAKVKESAIQKMRKYGVGTCGPPGFYGTLGSAA